MMKDIDFTSLPPRNKYGINSGGSPDVVPAKAGNQRQTKLDSCFCRNDISKAKKDFSNILLGG